MNCSDISYPARNRDIEQDLGSLVYFTIGESKPTAKEDLNPTAEGGVPSISNLATNSSECNFLELDIVMYDGDDGEDGKKEDDDDSDSFEVGHPVFEVAENDVAGDDDDEQNVIDSYFDRGCQTWSEADWNNFFLRFAKTQNN